MRQQFLSEVIHGFGHKNVQAVHPTTLEFTRDRELSNRGDCILVVAADKAAIDLDTDFKKAIKKPHSRLTVKIEADDVFDEVHAFGSPELTMTHPMEIVMRKSTYSSDRTLGICADKAACDISRRLVERLKNPRQLVKITILVQV